MATVILIAVLIVAGLLLVARYGADSRSPGDPTGRDPGWSDRPVRDHTPREDFSLARAALARAAAQVRCWEIFDRSLRPWEAPRVERTRRSCA